jgi:hypothetical protein
VLVFGSLRSVSPQQILKNTELIVAQDRKLTLRLLEHLYEIDRQKLYLEQGFASTFEYCTKHLKLSEPSAARRIRTARCVARYPQLHPLLESGELNLTVVAMVSKYIKPDNVDEIIARIKGRSKRHVEKIIAEYAPRAAVPADRVRMMVVAVKNTPAVRVARAATHTPTLPAVPAPAPSVAAAPISAAAPASAVAVAPSSVCASGSVDLLSAVIAASPRITVTGDSEKSPNCHVTESPARKAVTQPEENAPAIAGTITQFERLARVEFHSARRAAFRARKSTLDCIAPTACERTARAADRFHGGVLS